jgi:hypothetical protein
MPRPTSPARSPLFHTAIRAPRPATVECRECAGLRIDVLTGRSLADGADPCDVCNGVGRTMVPPAPWATDAELVGGAPRALTYPAPSAAMAAVETWRPAAGGAAWGAA